MIDLHCHLLPGVDDGSSSAEESRAMLRAARDAGVKILAATPHSRGLTPSAYRALFHQWRQIAEEYGVELCSGVEYDYISLAEIRSRGDEAELIFLNDAGALLVDFDCVTDMLPQDWHGLVNWPRAANLKRVVAAHPERLFSDPVKVGRILAAAGISLQVNAGSLLGRYGGRVARSAYRLLDAGLCHCIAGDAHRPNSPWLMQQARLKLAGRYDETCLRQWFEDNPGRLLAGKSMLPVRPKIGWLRRLFNRFPR